MGAFGEGGKPDSSHQAEEGDGSPMRQLHSAAIFGVTKTISSVRCLRSVVVLKRYPRMGIDMRKGIPASDLVTFSEIKPPIAMVSPSRRSTVVSALRVLTDGGR